MKKLLCVLMALCLMMSAALAEEAVELNWSDFEPILEAGGVTGQFYTFDEVAVKMWVPDGLEPVELSEEDVAKGFIGYFAPEDGSAAVSIVYVDINDSSLEDYAAYLPETGATEIETGIVNGLPCVSYKLPEQDSVSVTFTTEAGYALEVTCTPLSEENAELVWGAVISSIQATE